MKRKRRREVGRLGCSLRRKGEKKRKNKRKGRKRNLESFPNLKILVEKEKGAFMILIENGFIKDQDSKCKKIFGVEF
jgi:hypothetical protein